MLYSLFTLTDSGSVDEIISLDVVSNFKESYSANIPENPVEAGFNVSDTINLSNPTFNLSGLITDSKFNVSGHLVRYVNGQFVKSTDGQEQPQIQLDKPSLVVRKRLIDLYLNKEVFGVLEHIDAQDPTKSSVRYIYPCAISTLDFDKSDSSDAIYPTMTIKNIRVSYVEFREVKDATPDLIPLVKDHLNTGNVTGVTGSTPIEKGGSPEDFLKDQKKAADAITKDVAGDGNFGGDKGVHAELGKDLSKQNYTNEALRKFREGLESGKVKASTQDIYVETYVRQKMNAEYGQLNW